MSGTSYDVVVKRGTIYDGSGGEPFVGDVAIKGDRIAEVSPEISERGTVEIDATGLAVAPGFINTLSWANESLIEDGRSQSDIRQGVTTEVLGEGWSMGPWNEAMKEEEIRQQGDVQYGIKWTTLGEYLEYMVQRGVSPNIASFVGSATVRIHELGYEDRPPTAEELERMRALVRSAMEEGAIGVSSALIYAPATYATTDELVALAEAAASYGGLYISHLRSEGEGLLEAFDEFMTIAKRASVAAEVYHIKASGASNWSKLDTLIESIEAARNEGLAISADMYTYNASSTGLNAMMPPWVQEGGHRAWVGRLQDPAIRERLKKEITLPSREWDNTFVTAGSAENVLMVGFKKDSMKHLTGLTLAEIAAQRGKSPEETAMDLVVEDDNDVTAAYFTMSEDNIRKKVKVPWISFCSDAQSVATEGVFLKRNPHPRTYGAFARLLGRYVRDEGLIPLEEAVRRLTSLPAANFKLIDRGSLKRGSFADVVAFDPATIEDRATFKNPHQYATGMVHVLVNGKQVLKDGEHTGAKPGTIVRGPGWLGHGR